MFLPGQSEVSSLNASTLVCVSGGVDLLSPAEYKLEYELYLFPSSCYQVGTETEANPAEGRARDRIS